MKSMIFKISIIAVILAAGWIAVFNIPDAVESFLPVAETISLIPTEHHQIVSGTGVVSQSANGDHWYVTVSIGERDIRRIKIGQTAEISGAAFDDGVFTAAVYDIGTLAVTRQGDFAHETVVEVVLKIDNPNQEPERGELRPGNSARADIRTGDTENIFILPYSAIMQDEVGEFVFVLAGNLVVRRDIVTGAELSDGAQILAGLNECDQILAAPESVNDGQLLKNENTGDE
jgi:hypothetical protein